MNSGDFVPRVRFSNGAEMPIPRLPGQQQDGQDYTLSGQDRQIIEALIFEQTAQDKIQPLKEKFENLLASAAFHSKPLSAERVDASQWDNLVKRVDTELYSLVISSRDLDWRIGQSLFSAALELAIASIDKDVVLAKANEMSGPKTAVKDYE